LKVCCITELKDDEVSGRVIASITVY
jgi:hypothetical protein